MSLNSFNIISIKEDNERVDPKFYHLPSPEPNKIENIQEFLDNIEEVPENINFRVISNIKQIGQNETQNELNLHSNLKGIEKESEEEKRNCLNSTGSSKK